MSTETPLIVYLRHSPRKELAAELCIKDDNNYQLIGVSDRALFNMAKEAITILTARHHMKERMKMMDLFKMLDEQTQAIQKQAEALSKANETLEGSEALKHERIKRSLEDSTSTLSQVLQSLGDR